MIMQPSSTPRPGGGGGNLDAPNQPPDVFCNLGSLIVEGRVPREGDKGYREGPHVPQPGANIARHACTEDSYMCKKDENFRKHMLLLWQNNVPVSIEVLLCPDCRLGRQKARSIEFSTIPEPGSILLEQWTVSIQNTSPNEELISSRGLFRAVRSYLHFSQLSAWLSSTRGENPKNVLFRITIPGEAFGSKFKKPPEQHIFPPADAGRNHSVHVSVRNLPRVTEIPRVLCGHPQTPTTVTAAAAGHNASSGSSSGEEGEDAKLGMAGALSWKEMNNSDSDLRKALVKSKLAESCQAASTNLPRSDSMDSMLGDSLLDPPQSLQKIPPKRYQSPSRCGSPSLETPEHLLFGSKRDQRYDPSFRLATSSKTASERCARQDLIRRRDMNLYYGLHPRLLHSGQMPRLSLPLKNCQSPLQPRTPTRPCGPVRPVRISSPEDDEEKWKQVRGSREHVRRRISPPSDTSSSPEKWTHEYSLEEERRNRREEKETRQNLPSSRSKRKLWEEEGIECDADYLPTPGEKDFLSDQWDYHRKSSDSSRSSSIKDDEPLSFKVSKTRATVENIFDDGSDRSTPAPLQNQNQASNVTQVFRAETTVQIEQPPLDKGALLLNSIMRTSERNKRMEEEERARRSIDEGVEIHKTDYHPLEINNGIEMERLEEKMRKGLKISSPSKKEQTRFRSVSERASTEKPDQSDSGYQLDPLDMSFENDDEYGQILQSPSYDEEYECVQSDCEDEKEEKENVPAVPSSGDKDSFRKSFDSAASMVFHRRTGLPLTSSPAPLRKGKAKFDFDSSITSPHDIKRALFRAESPPTSPARKAVTKRTNHRRVLGLSTSCPATVTSSNLLGNFEESVLNGRLDPVSTVEGFTAEIGASGSFHPKHKSVPVTVFFYTLCDNTTISSPYLGHINLGKKGYRVPSKGTIQVTLFNPLGTVVKMFVVVYNLSDMPPNSQTFLRQRTLYMPSDLSKAEGEESQKWLRYLIHLRFASSRSGKIYLHTDMRMIIFRKSDLDTATDHSPGKGFELRSFTKGPTNPKFSPRKPSIKNEM